MKKKIIYILIGVTALSLAYWLISPIFRNIRVNESIDSIQPDKGQGQQVIETIHSGQFTGVSGHHAEGTADLIKSGDKYIIRFENDFKITNGPDLLVYLGKGGQYYSNAKIAELKGNIGSQNYELPSSININDYNEVWVWCRSFHVGFGMAELK